MASSLFLSPAAAVSRRFLAFPAGATPPRKKSCSTIGRKIVVGGEENAAASSRGFSFTAAGLLFPYYIGVAQLLIEKGYLKETVPLAGCSAGAIVSIAIASGVSMDDVLRATKRLARNCRLHGTMFRLGSVLRETLDRLLPDDIHIKSNGRVRVAVTQVDNLKLNGLLIDKFESKGDLINALLASSYIPGYLAPMPAMVYRDRLCIDGGMTFIVPPTCAAHTIGVCAFPGMGVLQEIGISPDCNSGDRANILECLNWVLRPAASDVLDRLFHCGYTDAAVWAEQNP